MFESIAWYASAFAGAIYLVSPFAVHSTLRFASRCKFDSIPLDRLPEEIAAEFRRRISEFTNLGFELIGCFDCGALAGETRTYVAYFCNHTTNEFANVTAMATPDGPASYFEISSRFSNGHSIETNTNAILPLLPANPNMPVFRFAEIDEPRALLQLHRRLTEKYAPGLCPLAEPRDSEILRYARMIENFGPRLAQAGYLKLSQTGDAFRLTWKGAFRMAWLGLWPVTLLRRTMHRHAMRLEMQSLEPRAVADLQKA
jgi:hypothetical protein